MKKVKTRKKKYQCGHTVGCVSGSLTIFFRGYISDHLMIGNKFCHGQLASTFVLLMVVSWLSLSDSHLHLAIDLSQGPPICL